MDGSMVAESIRKTVHNFGIITSFKAYLQIKETTKRTLRSELQSSGVSLTDTPHNQRKDAADKMILVDMLAFAIDNPPPATIVLISGDRDFVYALSILHVRLFLIILDHLDNVVLIVPNKGASSILKSQSDIVLEWRYDVLSMDIGYLSPDSSPDKGTPGAPFTHLGSNSPPRKLEGIDQEQSSDNKTLFHLLGSNQTLSPPRKQDPILDPMDRDQCGVNRVHSGHHLGNTTNPLPTKKQESVDQDHNGVKNTSLTHIGNPRKKDVTEQEQSGVNKDILRVRKVLVSSDSLSMKPLSKSISFPDKIDTLSAVDDNDLDPARFLYSPGAPGFFDNLVEVLNFSKMAGVSRPKKRKVVKDLLARNPLICQRVNLENPLDYLKMAEDQGIVITGGTGANAWISMNDDFVSKF